MPTNPPPYMPRVTPTLFYDDPATALDWLAKAFGFVTRMSLPGSDGAIIHAEMQVGDCVIMLSPTNVIECFTSPRSLGEKVTQALYIYVDDVDTHCAQAQNAGARILGMPQDVFWGDRSYVAADLEGHRWTFAQHVRDVALENMTPA